MTYGNLDSLTLKGLFLFLFAITIATKNILWIHIINHDSSCSITLKCSPSSSESYLSYRNSTYI